MTTDILLDPNEWEAPTGPLANLAAEAVAAERLLALDPRARWFGGNGRGADVKSRTLRVDAKRVTVHQVDGSCVVRLVRRDGVPFDPAVVDVLCLVHMVRHSLNFASQFSIGPLSCFSQFSKGLDHRAAPAGTTKRLAILRLAVGAPRPVGTAVCMPGPVVRKRPCLSS